VTDPLWITEAEVVAALSLPEAIEALEKGLALEAAGTARNMAKTHQIWGGHHTLHAIGAVVEGAHTVGTYVGQSYLRLLIRRGRAPKRLVNARDVGVSYFLLGLTGALTGYVQPPWRSRSQLTALATLTANAVARPTFTEVGHLTAFVVGLAAVPVAPRRDRMPYPPAALGTKMDA